MRGLNLPTSFHCLVPGSYGRFISEIHEINYYSHSRHFDHGRSSVTLDGIRELRGSIIIPKRYRILMSADTDFRPRARQFRRSYRAEPVSSGIARDETGENETRAIRGSPRYTEPMQVDETPSVSELSRYCRIAVLRGHEFRRSVLCN